MNTYVNLATMQPRLRWCAWLRSREPRIKAPKFFPQERQFCIYQLSFVDPEGLPDMVAA
jgi:hypothetical protein